MQPFIMSNISSTALLTSVALLFATPIGLDAANGRVETKPRWAGNRIHVDAICPFQRKMAVCL